MQVQDVMTRSPIVAAASTPIGDAAALMKQHNVRRLPVVSDGRVIGIVTDRDLKEAKPPSSVALSAWELKTLLSRMTLQGLMRRPVITLPPDAPLEHASRLMMEKKIGGIPIVEDGRLVGIVTESDVLRVLTEILEREVLR